MLKELTTGDIDTFRRIFKDIIEKYFSYYNVGRDKGEEFYHAFSLGLFINLIGKYNVRSEAESGYGRSDLLLIPYDKKGRGIVIEIKRLDDEKETELLETAKDALNQIEKRQYAKELEKEGITNIVKLGIGFRGKEMKMSWK